MDKLRKAYDDIILWVMTVKAGEKSDTENTKKFDVSFNADGDRLQCSITGRLDTITATELLSGFEAHKGTALNEIVVDLKDTEYISSAGLRVLLIMCKSLPDQNRFHLENPSTEVLDILNVTGFAEIFNID